jgi:predicted DNA-binding transcriptional regulator AlpA
MSVLHLDLDALAEAVADRVIAKLARQPAGASAPQLLTRAQVAERIGRSVSTVKRLQAVPGFPRPVRLAGGRPQWRASEIELWLQEGCVD